MQDNEREPTCLQGILPYGAQDKEEGEEICRSRGSKHDRLRIGLES
jgi:hypothetical protein